MVTATSIGYTVLSEGVTEEDFVVADQASAADLQRLLGLRINKSAASQHLEYELPRCPLIVL